jgi:hypothetical protein
MSIRAQICSLVKLIYSLHLFTWKSTAGGGRTIQDSSVILRDQEVAPCRSELQFTWLIRWPMDHLLRVSLNGLC